MGNTNSAAVGTTRRRVLPLVLVLAMAALVALVMLYAATANGYEGSATAPCKKPVIVEKQLEPGLEPDDTEFKFELIVSPTYIDDKHNQIDKGSSAVTSVEGIVYNADGTPVNGLGEDGLPVKSSYPIKDHKITFTLKAGQKVLFEKLPFANKDADCGFVVNEIIGDDSAAAQAGYAYSKVEVTDGAQYATTNRTYLSLKSATGTIAKAIYDSYEEYPYVYYDAAGKIVANPVLDGAEFISVYFNDNTDSSTTNWFFNISENGSWVYYDWSGNRVDDPNSSNETCRSAWVKDGKLVLCRVPGTTPIHHATEVRFTNKIAPLNKPLTIAKKLSTEGAEPDNTDFKFELIISPDQIGTKDAVSVQRINGTIYGPGDATEPFQATIENSKFTFSLKAGQYIVFDKVPFSRADGETGKYIVNELTDAEPGEGEITIDDSNRSLLAARGLIDNDDRIIVEDGQVAYGYSFDSIELSDPSAAYTSTNGATNALVTETGKLGQTVADGMTTVTVYNNQ